LPWTRPGSVARYAARVEFEYTDARQRIPDLVIRGHVHRWGDSYDAHRVRAIMSPAWTAADGYAHKIAPGCFGDIGGVFIYCDGGHYEIEKFKVKPKARIWTKI
jgi:hypothetical protein